LALFSNYCSDLDNFAALSSLAANCLPYYFYLLGLGLGLDILLN
jgi:hypothetical protein